jgi:hypothetical protein
MCRERDGASDFFVSSDGGRIPITEQAYTEMALTQKPQEKRDTAERQEKWLLGL